MSLPAISIRALGKRYRIGQIARPKLVSELLANPRALLRRRDPKHLWALRDVSFDVGEHSVLGLIGRNGAGKSTLLKILSRITEPTEGEARLYGRVASLLEVGTGFHPELTGRENVYLNGSILGMTRAEIRSKFDEIVAFAEVDALLDTPVKRYSSGMYVRLAFAVAAHLEPDILLVDEVLSVGDSAFQRKCIGKLQDIGRLGRTVVLVSHNMDTMSRLCDRVVWIAGGTVRDIGSASAVIGRYLGEGLAHSLTWVPASAPNSEFFRYHSVSISRGDGEPGGEVIPADVALSLAFDFSVLQALPPGRLAFRIEAEDGRVVLSSASTDGEPTLNVAWAVGRTLLRCLLPGRLLAPGRYFVTVSEPTPRGDTIHEGVLSFSVSEQGSPASRDGRPGIIAPLLQWSQEHLP